MDESQEFELVAASLRADARDMHTFVQELAAKLEGALPGHVMVERRGGLFGREKEIRRITVALGDTRYDLSVARGGLDTTRARAVRGIVLKTEPLPLDAWIDDLSRSLAEEARSSEGARQALERLIIG